MSNRSLQNAAESLWTACAFLKEALNPPSGTGGVPLSGAAAEGLASILGYMEKDAIALWRDQADREEASTDD